MRPRGSVISALVGVTVAALLSGCGADDDVPNVATREPAVAAVAPAPAAAPAGEVLGVAVPVRALLAESGTGRLAALADTTLTLIDPAAPAEARTVTLPGPGASLSQGAPGEILVAAPQRIVRVDVAGAALTETPVDGDVRTVRRRDDGSYVLGTADGKVRTVSAAGETLDTAGGLVSADVVALTADRIAVLDRRQTSITEIDPAKDSLGLALRAGDGATNMIADHFGRVLVTDTAGGELLVYTTGPLVLRQRFPVGSSPYALAYDRRSETVWVTCTQSNEVVGFDLSAGIPEEVGRHPTVRQPDAVTVDERTGDLFVGSATGDGVQRIPADQLKRGQ